MGKVEYEQQTRDLYRARSTPALVRVHKLAFLMIDGEGDPNTSARFPEVLEALYSVSYAIKMSPKRGAGPDGYFEYKVSTIEGLWWMRHGEFDTTRPDDWLWTMMIRQPDFVNRGVVGRFSEETKTRKPNPVLDEMRFEEFEEGLCAQVLHLGSYDAEAPTLAKLHKFIADQGYETRAKHHEIYLNDPQRVAPAKLKTIIRQPVARD